MINLKEMEKKEVEKLVSYIKLAWDRKLTESTGGNMSVKVGEKIYITPTYFVKHFLTVDDISIINFKGEKIKNKKVKISSEYKMHLRLYKERKDIKSIFHAHPRYALILAISNKKLNVRYFPESIENLSNIIYIPYHTPGTDEFADSFIEGARKGSNVFILKNHGVTVCGPSIEAAFATLENLETCCFAWVTMKLLKEKPSLISEKDAKILLGHIEGSQNY